MYGTWASSLPMPDVGTKFSFCGNNYIISKFKIDLTNFGLFTISHVLVPPKKSIEIMLFCGPRCSQSPNYLNIVPYKHNILLYNICMHGYA